MRATKTSAGTRSANINDKLARLEDEQSELGRQDDMATQDIIPLQNLHQMCRDRVQSLMTRITSPDLRFEAIDLIHDR